MKKKGFTSVGLKRFSFRCWPKQLFSSKMNKFPVDSEGTPVPITKRDQ